MKHIFLILVSFHITSLSSDLSELFIKDLITQAPQAKEIAETYEKLQERKASPKDYFELLEEISKIKGNTATPMLHLLRHSIHKYTLVCEHFGTKRPEVPRAYFNLVKALPKVSGVAINDPKLSDFSKYLFRKAQFWDFYDRKLTHKAQSCFHAWKKVIDNKEIWENEKNHFRLTMEIKDLINFKSDNQYFMKSYAKVENLIKELNKLENIPQWYKNYALGSLYAERLKVSLMYRSYKIDRDSVFKEANELLINAFQEKKKGYIGAALYQLHMHNYDPKTHRSKDFSSLKNLISELDKVDEHYPEDYSGVYFGLLGNFHYNEKRKILNNIQNLEFRFSLVYFIGDSMRNYIHHRNTRIQHTGNHKQHAEFTNERPFKSFIEYTYDLNILKGYLRSLYKLDQQLKSAYFGDKNFINAIAFSYFFLIGDHTISNSILKKSPEITSHRFLKFIQIEEHDIGFSHAVTGNAGKLIENIRTLYRDPYNLTFTDPFKLKDMIREVEDAKAITADARANRFFEYYLSFLKMEKNFHENGVMEPKMDKDFSMFFTKGIGFLYENNKVNCFGLSFSAPKLFLKSPIKNGISIELDFVFQKLRKKHKNIYPFGLFIQSNGSEHYAWYDPIKQKAGFTKQTKYLDLKTFYSDTNCVDAKFGKKVKMELQLKNQKASFLINGTKVLEKDFDFNIGLAGFGIPNGVYDFGNMEVTNFKIKKLE